MRLHGKAKLNRAFLKWPIEELARRRGLRNARVERQLGEHLASCADHKPRLWNPVELELWRPCWTSQCVAV